MRDRDEVVDAADRSISEACDALFDLHLFGDAPPQALPQLGPRAANAAPTTMARRPRPAYAWL